jgi:hypothetical protein
MTKKQAHQGHLTNPGLGFLEAPPLHAHDGPRCAQEALGRRCEYEPHGREVPHVVQLSV